MSAVVLALHPSGFEVRVQVPIEQLDATIAQLQARGYRPTGAGGDGWQRTPDGLPLCSRHGAVMARREKQGDVWFSHQIEDGSTGELLYCRGYAGANSAGWAIPPRATSA